MVGGNFTNPAGSTASNFILIHSQFLRVGQSVHFAVGWQVDLNGNSNFTEINVALSSLFGPIVPLPVSWNNTLTVVVNGGQSGSAPSIPIGGVEVIALGPSTVRMIIYFAAGSGGFITPTGQSFFFQLSGLIQV